MISKKKKSKEQTTTSGKDGNKGITISMEKGWNIVNKVGILPFFKRVENMDNDDELQKISIDKQQYIEVYDTIFTMCIQREPANHSAKLYEKHSEALTKQYKEKFIPSLDDVKTEQASIFLKEWDKRWRCNKWDVIGMTRMFTYLNRFHVPNSEDLLNTTEQGHTLYRQTVFEQFKEIATNAILGCIRRERDGEEQDRDLLRDSIAVFVELGNKLKKVELEIYKTDFHKYLVAESIEYYKQKSRFWLDQQSCPEYLIQAEKCVQDELSRLSAYIDKYSENELMTAVRAQLLKNHQDELLLVKKSGINAILQRTVGADAQSAKEDLSRIYRLYSFVPGGNSKVADAVKAHITNLGNGYIDSSKQSKDTDAHKLITQLIELHDRFLKIVKIEFNEEAVFHKALKEAFETFINKEYYTSALLARYANDLLKKGSKLSSSGDLESTMDHVVMLYGYIRDKDIFERDYQMYLASRLLQNLSESEQSERSMIGKLKNEAGYHWTSKLEDMFKDIQRSKELIDGFKQQHGDEYQLELNVSVCTTGAWPDASIQPVKQSIDIASIADKFKQYYLNRFSGRKLRYQMDKGKADVQVQFNAKTKKILVVSTYQMLLLLLFNNRKTITFKEMLDLTGIPREELQVAALSMAHPKIKVMRKAPNTKEVADTHKFQINPSYSNARSRIQIPTLSIAQKKDPNKVDPAIFTLRRHQMDAAIVRIMKARQTLKHQDLVTEVVRQLIARFKPKGSEIKKRIANLIDLEYLERDENDRQLYHYKQ